MYCGSQNSANDRSAFAFEASETVKAIGIPMIWKPKLEETIGFPLLAKPLNQQKL